METSWSTEVDEAPVVRMIRIWIRSWKPDSRKLSWKEPVQANVMASSIILAFLESSVSVRAWLIDN